MFEVSNKHLIVDLKSSLNLTIQTSIFSVILSINKHHY